MPSVISVLPVDPQSGHSSAQSKERYPEVTIIKDYGNHRIKKVRLWLSPRPTTGFRVSVRVIADFAWPHVISIPSPIDRAIDDDGWCCDRSAVHRDPADRRYRVAPLKD